RADRAAIVYTADGGREEIACGDSKKALEYEVEDMEKAVSEHLVSESMALSRDVMWLLSSVQKRWEEQGGQKDVPVLHI
ncbi:gfo/Idh/MocA family oxidoreductase, partial [Anaerotignum faecicola]|nr:gfo/Idh/MocA family oxidoreductase [Anaerotignum faecicola]